MKIRGYLFILILVVSLPAGKMQTYKVEGNFRTLDNTIRDFDMFEGEYTVLDIFGTWCGPCEIQMPHLKDVHDTIQGEAELVSISMGPDETLQEIRDFKERFEATWLFGRDVNDSLFDYFSVEYFPTTLIISPEGDILKSWVGITDSDTILKELDKYLDLPGSFARKFNLGEILGSLFSSPFFIVFLILLWSFIIYSGFYFIKELSEDVKTTDQTEKS